MLRHQRAVTLLLEDAMDLSDSFLMDKKIIRDETDSYYGFHFTGFNTFTALGMAEDRYEDKILKIEDLYLDDLLWLYNYTVDVGG